MSKRLWLTYAWTDNENGDVDFVAQELTETGIDVRLDRWTIGAGRRLWEQIEDFIMNPNKCDAWSIFATSNSLGSERCKEEFAYALHRSLVERGATFPIVGIFPCPVDQGLIPAGIKTRLHVSLTDPDWKERVVAATENRVVNILRPAVEPYCLQVHQIIPDRLLIEVRPRAGVWSPFLAGIPIEEKEDLAPSFFDAPAGRVPKGSFGTCQIFPFEEISLDQSMWVMGANEPATPYHSYFIGLNRLPSRLVFGVKGSPPQYLHTFLNRI